MGGFEKDSLGPRMTAAPAQTSSGGRAVQLKASLRGLPFAQQEAMLRPGGESAPAVQMSPAVQLVGDESLKWGDPKSTKAYGHTFKDHGQKVKDNQLKDRARGLGHQVGAWTDDAAAAARLWAECQPQPDGTKMFEFDIAATDGRAFLPTGEAVDVDRARVVMGPAGGIKTAYPFSSQHAT